MLVKALDVAKRHVELSLWIVDLNKSDLERLGTSWSGSITIGDKLGVSLNRASIKYPRWQSIHRRGKCVRREETGDGGFAPGITDSGKCSRYF